MNYGSVIRGAWQVTWRHRFLWVLGLFATGGFGSCGGGGGSTNWRAAPDDLQNLGPEASRAVSEVGRWLTQNSGLVAGLIAAACALALVFVVLSLIAQGGMAHATAELGQGRESSLGDAWRAGVRLFWRYLALWLVLVAAALVVAAAVALVFAIGAGLASVVGEGGRVVLAILGGLLALVIVLIAIPLAIAVGVVVFYAQRAIAVEDVGPIAALRSGASLLSGNLWTSVVLWLLSLALYIGAGIGLAIAAVLLLIPLGIVGALFFAAAGLAAPTIAYAAIAVILFVLAMWVVSAVVNTYFWSYWTLAYLRVSGRTGG